jgi:hypothetical protein
VLLFPIIEKDRELNKFKMSRVNMGLVSHHCHIHCLYTNAKLHPGVLLSNLFQCHLCLRVFMAGGPDLLPTFGASRRESTSYMLQQTIMTRASTVFGALATPAPPVRVTAVDVLTPS